MKVFLLRMSLVCIVLGSVSIQPVLAAIYFFDPSTLSCRDINGMEGYNRNGWKPCTDFTRGHERDSGGRLSRKNIQLTGSTFENRTLRTTFLKTGLGFSNLTNSVLSGSIFDSTDLTGARLQGAEMYHVVFRGKVQTQGASLNENTRIKGWTYENIEGSHVLNEDETWNFIFKNDMIFWGRSLEYRADREVHGGVLTSVEWNESLQTGSLTLNLFTRSIQMLISSSETANRARRWLNQKTVIAYTEKEGVQSVVSVFPLSLR